MITKYSSARTHPALFALWGELASFAACEQSTQALPVSRFGAEGGELLGVATYLMFSKKRSPLSI
ncbi:MAG TPA: hypothetical protein V6C91_15720 [Coleofasciculaceae cyanobacterium]